ncbi:amino acid ABC transporter substrate-binding protein [Delftia tsuruhatensis]|uniref:amino acid ABC transporter substrate-binding protein n=1 Tax=Delftia tsuruhatensis TaxID=180282 RepID=UPI0020901E15|nr:amino acid ABC transporter substrate-binding protein [Delftia tsuruhatensis]MCO5338436.1 amino acid ABC transporter substrate-binding protein [Delftia tsuruhatensis]MCR4547138.1 amino acid ABC transporter substrate-binding protein [Delftia tsuruhatensis]MDH0773183.1 amino acid ABC transporter substrate-binding protein [Delftia tsuruhatensis]MDH1457591.1 amino acid ABC transporter substrate-binding protein [Delftia tsuruhatensis]MDH1826699.1 amino acid ABC transporter substrate-binding prote
MIFRQWGIALGALGLWALSGVSAAGVLDKIQAGGALVIAHRESSVPFSYIDTRSGKPVGYALDLCLRLAEAVRKQTGRKDMKVEFLMVTPANRMAVIEQGKADMECGSTTNNAQRRQTVAFTVPHFITGARMLVKADSTINAMEDLKGKKLVSTKGTSPMALVTQANRQRLMGITIVEAPDHARALEMVEKGEADAFVMDDVLLNGLAAARPDPRALKVVGKFLSTEPLAIMLPKADTAFKKLVDEEMKQIITSREIHPIYEKWFLQPIPPSSTNLNLPISYLLRDFWKYPTADILL